MAAQLYKTTSGHMFHAGDIAIVTVGLPARGKTYLAHKLARYLRWLGIPTSIFSIGDYRRRIIGKQMSHDYFWSEETRSTREGVADGALEDLIRFIKKDGGQVGIYDGSNTEEKRRKVIYERLRKENIQVLFFEVMCDKPEIIEANIRQVKISSPDYQGVAPDSAVKDFLKRIEGYIPTYTHVDDPDLSYVKLINVGDKIIVNNVRGYLMTRIVYYLMNSHIVPRKIYLVRNGRTVNEASARTDAPLSPRGLAFSKSLPKFLDRIRSSSAAPSPLMGPTTSLTARASISSPPSPISSTLSPSSASPPPQKAPLKIWTSPRQRSAGTARYFHESYHATSVTVEEKWNLVEMNPGIVDGLATEEIQTRYKEDYERWLKDPYHYRYPRAESYHDLAIRLEEILLELEREKDDVLIIAHETVLKCIYAYLLDRSETEIPTKLHIPWDTVYELTPVAYGCNEKTYVVTDEI